MENLYADPVIYMTASCIPQVHQVMNCVVSTFINVTRNELHVLMYIKIVQKVVNNKRIRSLKLQEAVHSGSLNIVIFF